MNILELILGLEKTLQEHNPIILTYLNKGLDDDYILNISPKIVFKLPENVCNLFKWANGFHAKKAFGGCVLFFDGYFYPFEDMLDLVSSFDKNLNLNLNIEYEDFFPLFSTLCIGINPVKDSYLKIYRLDLADFDPFISYFDSLEHLFCTAIECYKQNVYGFNEDGELDMDKMNWDLYWEIGKKLNPNSDFWKQE